MIEFEGKEINEEKFCLKLEMAHQEIKKFSKFY
jgi:hypothetical protein